MWCHRHQCHQMMSHSEAVMSVYCSYCGLEMLLSKPCLLVFTYFTHFLRCCSCLSTPALFICCTFSHYAFPHTLCIVLVGWFAVFIVSLLVGTVTVVVNVPYLTIRVLYIVHKIDSSNCTHRHYSKCRPCSIHGGMLSVSVACTLNILHTYTFHDQPKPVYVTNIVAHIHQPSPPPSQCGRYVNHELVGLEQVENEI